ncbi:glycerophosphoryl diester phosphodiesterase [Paenibacillus phyllosphaerae]|uniref:Glycerophosphoryl diester phosphodiesterase n=1 Tax=Paenibacillus phyllosphaerae TaxID=274593 RepID=A0A7W5ATC2_9BACL|nr:glycerophosphoryl diester phosphodiesterase [Paenibacillus phyllosphaerae]
MVVACAHRGASGLAPENTMAAFRKAMSFPYVQWMELDVQLSKDGIPVIIHDDTLRRTTTGSGKVADYTAEELGRIDAGVKFNKAFEGEGIPTLAQLLDESIGRCRLNIELKTYGGRYPELEKKVVELLYAKGLEHDSVITSFDQQSLAKVRALTAEVRTGLIIDGAPSSLLGDLRQLKSDFLSLGHPFATAPLLKVMRQEGIEVMVWTVNDAQTMRRLASVDPDLMICTNYPDRYGQAFGLS